jgi:RNA ligase (TIGR02306 family)
MERKLATIREVRQIEPIPNSDNIELIRVGGWQCVAKKGEFKQGDLCVYFEIDSILPENSHYEFIKDSKYRLRTKKIRGVISQGLAMPLEAVGLDSRTNQLGDDVTQVLNVRKYEPIIKKNDIYTKGVFPHFLRKTDQERIQNLTDSSHWLTREHFEITEKLDGQSVTLYVNTDENGQYYAGVCTRNIEKKVANGSPVWDTCTRNSDYEKLTWFCIENKRRLALQGEMLGPGIQGNRYGFKETCVYWFDIFDIDAQAYILPEERRRIMYELDLYNTVPHIKDTEIIMGATKEEIEYMIDVMIKFADGLTYYPAGDKQVAREGLVYRSMSRPFSFKVISNEYLLKQK